jgi:RNA polymerase sigma-70 factor (ECF subfamily)
VGVEEIVRRAQRGDPRAMAVLMDELAPYVGRICGSVALDHADDAAQETLIAVLRSVHTLREPRALRSWVRRIAVREAIRASQRSRGRLPVGPLDPADVPTLADGATALEVRDVLDALTPEQRAVLVLRHVDGATDAELAAALDVPTGTVKSRLFRARAAFKERWTA